MGKTDILRAGNMKQALKAPGRSREKNCRVYFMMNFPMNFMMNCMMNFLMNFMVNFIFISNPIDIHFIVNFKHNVLLMYGEIHNDFHYEIHDELL